MIQKIKNLQPFLDITAGIRYHQKKTSEWYKARIWDWQQ